MSKRKVIRQNNNLGILHFIGIGGIGMSGIADIMYSLGYQIQGSDLHANYNTHRLEKQGIRIIYGHTRENIAGASYVVVSSAIKPDNIELLAAIDLQIPIISRAEMLAELMRLKFSIAISGSHGKTTTTSLVACLFEAAGLDPTVINGGVINNKSTNAYLGASDYLIVEADESDATFIKIPSTIGVITNIDPEHMDYYQDFASLVAAFRTFIKNLPFYGFGVACIDHHVVRDLVKDIKERKIITYGIESEDAHVQAYNIQLNVLSSTFDMRLNIPQLPGVTTIEQITIPTLGRHNVLNALAAIAIGIELNFGIKVIKNGFKNFQGVKRRFTLVAQYQGVEIIDDYAHHPVEIASTLATARSIANTRGGRVIAVLQPHRYSRLKYLFAEFVNCFNDADAVYIMDVYAAGEQQIEGISGHSLAQAITDNGNQSAEYIATPSLLCNIVRTTTQPGDLFVMMGAGNITHWAYELPTQLLSTTTEE